MQKIDKEEAEKILLKTNEKPIFQNDPIGVSIDFILKGSHKTYRYVLVTALLAKSVNKDVDILSLQAKDSSVGAYDARSLCHKVIVPFERSTYPNSLGGSNEPFLNKPARFQRLAMTNAVRSGNDSKILESMINTLSEIKTKDKHRYTYRQLCIPCNISIVKLRKNIQFQIWRLRMKQILNPS